MIKYRFLQKFLVIWILGWLYIGSQQIPITIDHMRAESKNDSWPPEGYVIIENAGNKIMVEEENLTKNSPKNIDSLKCDEEFFNTVEAVIKDDILLLSLLEDHNLYGIKKLKLKLLPSNSHEISGDIGFKMHNIRSYNLDSELLLSSTLKIDRSQIILNLDKEIKIMEKNFFLNLIKRRKKNEPIAYIIGYKEFWKEKFKVNNNVLIPRPETEILVEQVINELNINSKKRILDIGTGSGCIILSILKERKKCMGVGIDISKNAIKLAKYNAKIQHIKNRIKFFNTDIDNFYSNKYDLIISNPPYIDLNKINDLDKDIKNHEPKIALDGGIDGYEKIRLVIKKSSNLIKRKGKLFLEVGFDQARETLRILNIYGFYNNKIVKDLSKKNRCIISTKI